MKSRIVDDAPGRRALYERLLYALQGEKDPWQECVKGAAAQEFQPIRLAPQREPAEA